MVAPILVLCTVVGLAVYFGIVRPFLIPIEWKIPTGRVYRATLGARNVYR
jgi:hypothetical protein